MDSILSTVGDLVSNPYFPEAIPALLVASALSLFFLVRLVSLAKRVGLVDRPSERKTHEHDVPLIGGVAIFLSFVLALPLAPFGLTDYRVLIFASGLLMIVGLLDDYNDVRPLSKVLGQLVVASLLVHFGNLVVPAIGDIFSWNDGNQQGLGPLAQLISIIAVVALINAYNMIDGHDGLISGIFQITALSLIVYCGLGGDWKLQFLLFLLLISVGIFFLFNLGLVAPRQYRSFMGDSGSMFLALVIAFAAINLTNEEGAVIRRVQIPWIIGLPIFDMVAVLVDRMRIKGSLVTADRRHIHHLLLKRGFSGKSVLIILLLIHLFLNIFGVCAGFFKVPDWILFWSLFPVLAVYLGVRRHLVGQGDL